MCVFYVNRTGSRSYANCSCTAIFNSLLYRPDEGPLVGLVKNNILDIKGTGVVFDGADFVVFANLIHFS
jgi:hypothetical protein